MDTGKNLDYSDYTAEELMDMYVNLDKAQYPEAAMAMKEELTLKAGSLSNPASPSRIKSFLKRWWDLAAVIFLMAVFYISSLLMPYTPGEEIPTSMYLVPVIRLTLMVSLLGVLLYKQRIIGALLIVLYFLFIMFGSFIF
jgi:hypothetical protein